MFLFNVIHGFSGSCLIKGSAFRIISRFISETEHLLSSEFTWTGKLCRSFFITISWIVVEESGPSVSRELIHLKQLNRLTNDCKLYSSFTVTWTTKNPPGFSVRQTSEPNSTGKADLSKPLENSKSKVFPLNGCFHAWPRTTNGGDAFLEIPMDSETPILFKAWTSSPVSVSMQREFDLGERYPSAIKSWKTEA